MRAPLCSLAALSVLWASPALAATLTVGKGQQFAGIEDAMAQAQPGDVIEVQGGQTYEGTINLRAEHSGTPDKPITIRGIPVDGKRPVLTHVGPGMWDNMVLLLGANHVVMESFEVIGDGPGNMNYCILHMADDVTVRDFVVHNCMWQAGLTGNDTGSGSLLLEYSEFYHNGDGEYSHQIYMATDEATYPNSTFRMQFCYLHDGLGGNNVASRSQRNEIYYNWSEGAYYHDLDLIGPDVGDPDAFREDSDVVGNVFIRSTEWRVARIGGDGTNNSAGRFRFANNTMIMADSSSVVISLQQTVQTLEMYNNVIFGPKAGYKLYDLNETVGDPTVFFGSHNWIQSGTTSIPKEFTNTIMGDDPGWVDAKNYDFRPTSKSPLVDQGTTDTVSTDPRGFPKALLLPVYHPPQHMLLPIGMADGRNDMGAPDIGAFAVNASAPGDPPQPPPPEMIGGGGGNGAGDGMNAKGCGCRTAGGGDEPAAWLAVGAAALAIAARRRRR
jgi:MYXO-CTERM domain-containing protein